MLEEVAPEAQSKAPASSRHGVFEKSRSDDVFISARRQSTTLRMTDPWSLEFNTDTVVWGREESGKHLQMNCNERKLHNISKLIETTSFTFGVRTPEAQ